MNVLIPTVAGKIDRTRTLAAELIGIQSGSLSDDDRAQLSLLLLDGLGTAYAGSNKPWISALHRWADRHHGSGKSKIIGSSLEVAAPIAALVNGSAFHSYELDDTHDASMTHPGAAVISAALAVGSERQASGSEVLAAIVAGYEAIARVGVAANAAGVMAAGYHATGLFCGFGSAVAASRLLGLGVEGLLTAWGHLLSMCAGSLQFSDEATGTSVKRLHGGFAAQNGVLASELAAAGIDAPLRSLDGKYGFLALYGKDPRPEMLQRENGTPFAIHEVSLKPYACCRLLHSVIDNLAALQVQGAQAFDTVRSIVVRGPGKIGEQHMLRAPASPMAAQYSLPFVVGATIEHGPHDFRPFEQDRLSDPAVLRWAEKIEFVRDEGIESMYPEKFGSAIEVEFSSSKRRSSVVMDSVGTPANPMSYGTVRSKAENLAKSVDPHFTVSDLEEAIAALPTSANVRELQSMLLSAS